MNTAQRMPPAGESLFEGNILLKALHGSDRTLLRPHLEPIVCARGDTLFAAGETVDFITLPCERMVAGLVVITADGRSAETATIGREGAVGGFVLQGGLPALARAVVQIPGPALRIESARLQEAARRSQSLCNLLIRYADCLLAQVLQSAACNALHSIEQRCLRTLMSLQDRVGSAVLPVTQEVLAAMLGVQRTYLTRVLSQLQHQGLIEVGRGRVTVLARPAVEAAACECHGCIRRHFEALLGTVHGRDGRFEAVELPPGTEDGAVRNA